MSSLRESFARIVDCELLDASMCELTVPSKLDGLAVLELAPGACEQLTGVERIVCADCIEAIGPVGVQIMPRPTQPRSAAHDGKLRFELGQPVPQSRGADVAGHARARGAGSAEREWAQAAYDRNGDARGRAWCFRE